VTKFKIATRSKIVANFKIVAKFKIVTVSERLGKMGINVCGMGHV
jgi:hypothetical protein